MRLPIRSLSLFLLLGCGCNPGEPGADEGAEGDTGEDAGDEGDLPPDDCDRLEVREAGTCEAVEVTGVETRALSFERAGWTLDGTLWYPLVDSPDYLAPGVVIVHGSGPMDRAGTVEASLGVSYSEPITIYADLAEQLAARGFAVLSYDKRSCFSENNPNCSRSVAGYPGTVDAIRIDDFLEDARAAAVALAAADEVAEDITLVGHSQGGGFVPTLAREEELIRGGAMLAGATLPLPDTLEGQYDDLADWLEANDPGNPAIEQLRMEADAARAALEAIAAGSYPEPDYLGASTEFWLGWINLQDALPAELEQLDEPLAAYFGEFDFNVGPAHVEQLQTWIDEGLVSPDVELRSYPDLTHAFVYVLAGGASHTTEFAPEVVEDLVAWMTQTGP